MSHEPTREELKERIEELERQNEELKIEEEKYRKIFENAGIPICLIDIETYKHAEFNRAAYESLGYTRDEFKDFTLFDIDPAIKEKDNASRKEAVLEKGLSTFEVVHKTKDNELRNISSNIVLVNIDGKEYAQDIRLDITKEKIAEQELKESEERYRTIVDLIPDGITIIEKGVIQFANKGYAKLMGVSDVNDIIGRSVFDLAPPALANESEHDLIKRDTLNHKPRRNLEIPIKRPDGKVIYVKVYSANIQYQGRDAIFSLLKDITGQKEEEKKLRENERRFHNFLKYSKDAYFMHDLDGKLIEVNQYACESLGYTREELLSLYIKDIDIDFESGDHKKKWGQMIPGMPITVEGIHRRKDGTTFPVEVRLSLYDSEGRKLMIGMIRDITDRKQIEEDLRNAIKAAEDANRSKSEFLANMSHEIRTPMNGVIGMTGLMLDTPLNAEQKEYLHTIRQSADSLLSIINDILDFSKIEAGKMNLEILDFNLRSAIEEVVDLPAMIAHEKGLEFTYRIHEDIPSLLRGDPGRLRQILINLMNNAVKFTEKGEVHLSLTAEKETESHITIRFTIKDTGIGISKNDLNLLFKSFHQVDSSSTRKYEGSGLGLAISKQLSALMGGEIGVESEEDKGSSFWFTAVFEKQPGDEKEDHTVPEGLISKRILIVDDSNTNLKILSGYLSTWGFNFDTAQSAEVALKLLDAVSKVGAPYDLVITDMQMPGMDGAELGQAIKSNQMLKDTLLIMLTSRGIRGDGAIMRQIGFNAYLTKPIRRSQLHDCIITVLSKSSTEGKSEESGLVTRHTIKDAKRGKTRILLAEDNVVNQKLALRLLEKFGFKADAVANGNEAIKALEIIPYDIVLMDIQMPEMDGLEATKIIRNPTSNILKHDSIIIALTAHAMKGDRDICIEAGMDDYISKPIDPNQFFQIIEKYLPASESK